MYDYPHIGNYRAYVFGDLLKRYLKYKGYKVMHIMNLTDVDDKTIRDSQKEGKSLKEFTDFYIKGFYEDLETLHIEQADVFPKATEHIPEMVALIKKLLEKGFAYNGEDNSIYFNIRKFKEYGKLSGINLADLEEGASGRIKKDEYAKENANDFALWKAYDESDGDVFWETELSKGRPGWHIECSAMSSKYLGETFDIHAGGVDLIFPHHENEIAQSECANGKPFVKYWMHNEWLLVEGKKMAKSAGSFYTLRDILSKGYSPMAVRYALLSTHYRQQLNFTFEGIDASKNSIERLNEFFSKVKEMEEKSQSKGFNLVHKEISRAKAGFGDSMDDDLNISGALAAVFDFVKEINKLMAETKISKKEALEIVKLMREFDRVLGILKQDEETIPEEIAALAEQRLNARKNKDWALSDQLRSRIKEKGYYMDDVSDGYRIKKVD